jgi:hypothetical protein
MTWLAAKRLSAVEVSADASHQHEFHAGALRKLLGFPERRTSGELAIIYHSADGSEPDVESCGFTLYDSREGQPRSAEYRLYFDSPDLQKRAASGDILVLSRPSDSDSLRALIIPAASVFGQALGRALDGEGIELTERFRDIAGTFGRASAAALLDAAAQPHTVVDPEDFLAVADGGFIGSALREGRLPGTREMAMEAGRIVGRLRRDRSNPDFDLKWSLDAETVLFQHIEGRLGQRWLDDRAVLGALRIEDTMQFALSCLQSRRTRRGQSLQNHFARILYDRGIPHGAQCTTEQGERPDFLFPGCREYADPAFPDDRLRMVACKSVLRDRWRQPLKEAARIPEKYLLTVDTEITEDVLGRMLAARLVPFLPRPTIAEAYGSAPFIDRLNDVSDLITRVEKTLSADG